MNVEEVCKGLQVPAITVSNECLEKRTEILPCQSISQPGRSRGDPGTATSVRVEEVCERLQVPSDTVSNESLEKGTKESPCYSSCQKEDFRASKGTTAHVNASSDSFLSQKRVKEMKRKSPLTC